MTATKKTTAKKTDQLGAKADALPTHVYDLIDEATPADDNIGKVASAVAAAAPLIDKKKEYMGMFATAVKSQIDTPEKALSTAGKIGLGALALATGTSIVGGAACFLLGYNVANSHK